MADDLIYDLANVTDALDDYLTIKEKNRNYIETSRTSGYGSKGANYNLKEFEYFDEISEKKKSFFGTAFDFKQFIGAEYLGEETGGRIYDEKEIEEIQQNLFSFYKKPNQETSPVSINEAKFVMDMQNVMEDYADYTKDDMILGDENIKNRLMEMSSLYDSYLGSREAGTLTPSKIDFYRDKFDKTEDRWGKFKETKMKKKSEEKPFEAAEYIEKTYGKNSVWYVHPETGDNKIGPPNANIPGSPLEGYTPMGNITGDTIEDFMESTGEPAYNINQEALKGRDKEQFNHYKDLMKFAMYELGTVEYIDDNDNTRKINVSEYLDSKMQNPERFREKMAKLDIKPRKEVETGIALLESVPEIKDFMDKMMPFETFKGLHDRWGWYLDPKASVPSWFRKDYGKPEKKGIPEYISPYLFDPKLKSRNTSSNPLGLDIPEDLFK